MSVISSNERSVHLLVPGLLGPMQQLEPLKPLPQLERLLSKADIGQVTGNDLESTLFPLFGISSEPGRELPAAPYRRIGDGCPRDDRFWLQANPVYLRPDQDRLLLFDSEDLGFGQDDAESLADLFKEHFAAEGWQLETPTAHRWYLALDRAPSLTTTALSQVFGRNIDSFLPQGEESMRWHGIMNEVQMLFYSSNLNFERESRGKLPVNGLWFSGGGNLHDSISTPFQTVHTDDSLARGLGLMSGATIEAIAADASTVKAEGRGVLVTYDRMERTVWRADPFDWADELNRFESWLLPMVDTLRQKKINQLFIYPCNGTQFRLSSSALRRFWRRRRGFSQWLEE
ncbi:MAG: hypothetical protein RPU64_05155 [Candidatus Sedimenticola sp. (ex Thyasira tokunagai)]